VGKSVGGDKGRLEEERGEEGEEDEPDNPDVAAATGGTNRLRESSRAADCPRSRAVSTARMKVRVNEKQEDALSRT
jgi:hypothetical protein